MATAKKSVKMPKPEAVEEIAEVKPVEKTTEEIAAEQRAYLNEKVTVELFYDGDRYKDPLYVSVGNFRGMLQRGIPILVPRCVYFAIKDMERQQRSARNTIKLLSSRDLEILNG